MRLGFIKRFSVRTPTRLIFIFKSLARDCGVNISMPTIITRWFDSKYSLWVLEIGLPIALVLTLFVVWSADISIETQYAPTIINGLTTSVAVLIGFGATCSTVMWAYYPQKQAKALVFVFVYIVPIAFLLIAYVNLVFSSDFQRALRLVLSSFVFAFLILFAMVFSMIKEHW